MSLSRIEIDGEALRSNLASLKTLAPPSTLACVVVKGNAYGHGLKEVLTALEGKADYFQVDDFEELAELRRHTSTPTLVLGYMDREEVSEAIELGSEIGVFDRDHLRVVGDVARSKRSLISVHLKVDALLGRLGTIPSEMPQLLEELDKWPEIVLRGIYAHFANIEDTTDLTHAESQQSQFAQVEALFKSWKSAPKAHISATSGLMTVENLNPRDMVRLGIGVYGMYPSGPLARIRAGMGLRPVLRWTSKLAQVKTLPAKHPIGYGLTYVTSKQTRVGIVPQGYSDGYDRGLSNSGEVLVRGMHCPVLGRVAMNMFAVDLTQVPDATRDDEVVLLGRQGNEEISAEDIASRLGTINYEITSRLSALIPRALK